MMKCPKCDDEMVDGEATVRGTPSGFFFFGFSNQHLWFRDRSGVKDLVVPSNGTTDACRCPKCGITVLTERPGLDNGIAEAGLKIGHAFKKWKQSRTK